MNAKELRDHAASLEAEAVRLRKHAMELEQAELQSQRLADRLVYAATSRCPCGLGLAYDPASDDPTSPFKGPSSWDCSGIILGTADASVKHTDKLPFAFYSIKSEGQPSACGSTTRPHEVLTSLVPQP